MCNLFVISNGQQLRTSESAPQRSVLASLEGLRDGKVLRSELMVRDWLELERFCQR